MTKKTETQTDLLAETGQATEPRPFRVLSVTARNFQCIRDAEISFDGTFHEIRGDANNGKSSVLAAIERGIRSVDPEMVHNEATSSEIVLDLDRVKVHRHSPGPEALAAGQKEIFSVTHANGAPMTKAEATALLRTLAGTASFRPTEWVALGGGDAKGRTGRQRQQFNQLLEALPMTITPEEILAAIKELGKKEYDAWGDLALPDIQFDQHPLTIVSQLETAVMEHRARLNVEADIAETTFKATPPPEKPPVDEDSEPLGTAEELALQHDAAHQKFYAAQAAGKSRDSTTKRIDELRVAIFKGTDVPEDGEIETTHINATALRNQIRLDIAQLETELNEKREEIEAARATLDQAIEQKTARNRLDAQQRELGELEANTPTNSADDLEDLQEALNDAAALVELRRAQDAHDAAAVAKVAARARADVYTPIVQLLRDTLPQRLLARANLPVEGLGIQNKTITVRGFSLHQLGTSEQIKIGVAIARALSPHCNFVLIDRAESLGRADLKTLAEMAKEQNFQIILTFVDANAVPGPGVTVMQDGQVLQEA